MGKVVCDGYTLAFSEQGVGEPVMLLHGFCGSSEYWDQAVPFLSGSCRCIVPDLRGHGSSDAPLGAYSIEQMADDVLKLLDELDLPKVTMLGHSMGGYITLSFAERYASRLNGFGLIHSTGYPDDETGKEKRLKAVSNIQSEGITAFIDGLIPGLFAPENAASNQELITKAKDIGYLTPPQGAIGAALAMRERPDRRDAISASTLPVLLVAGELDRICPPEKVFTADHSNITKVIIPGAGHMSMMEMPEELAGVIKDFLGHYRP
ncbi:alpha/beta hydrolase [Paenibacillus sp.]|jgi:pimeloyl-ACP methyl ester carboxylesterase|uniref:alpha/beta fold hydrolase n=1 Tax=Paenibacillus sp. TaxID=58172 RepID=UPI00281FD647|nr:alpha/beta hydrolase [Paenibacillus sp.]MDR0270937.1 alpha/beta hydrolase [Paenibacillus sp.]